MRNWALLFASICLFASCEKEPTLKRVDDVCTQMDDINFMKYCYENYDVNKDGKVSMEEAAAVNYIDVARVYTQNYHIASLTGIKYFVNLSELSCGGTEISSLDLKGMSYLTKLICGGSTLTSVNVENCSNLKIINCGVSEWGNDGPTGKVVSINVNNCPQLLELSCYGNKIAKIDLSTCTNLEKIRCYHNQLTTLDVSKCLALSILDCSNNPMTTLYLKKGQEIPDLHKDETCEIVYK